MSYSQSSGSDGLLIMNVMNVSSPFVVGSYMSSDSGNAKGVVVSSDTSTAFLLFENSFQIIDITNITSPSVIGNYSTSDAISLLIYEPSSYAFISRFSTDVDIVDFSNVPSSPSLIGQIPITLESYKTYIADDCSYVYVAEGENGFSVFDLANITNPVKLWSDTSMSVHTFFMSDSMPKGLAFVIGDWPIVFHVFDVSDPSEIWNEELGFNNVLTITLTGSTMYIVNR